MQLTVKKIAIFGALLVSLLVSSPPPATALVEDVLDILHVVKEVTTSVLKTWEIVQNSPLTHNIDFPLMREKQRKVLLRLKEVSRQIDDTEQKYAENVAAAVQSVNNFITQNLPLLTRMNDITDTMNRITARYQQMKNYEMRKDKLEMSTLVTFAEWSVAPNAYSVHHLMERLHLKLFGNEEKGNSTENMLQLLAKAYEIYLSNHSNSSDINQRSILDIVETVLRDDEVFSMSRIFQKIELIMVGQALYYRALVESNDQICHTQQSPQQFVYSMYTDIALTELKGYMMMEFSWMMLRVYGKGNFTEESALMRSDYEKRTKRTLKLLGEVMRRADRSVWRCDPDKFVKGRTYEEVTRLLQGYIENEVDINPDATCRETCSFYEATRTQGCFKDKFCARQQRCSGRLYECQFVDSDMWVCPSAHNSSRRYEYIAYENGRVLGKKGACARGTTQVESWWRYLFWHCSYCFCLCDEIGVRSDRYFSLREAVADIEENKVVTGLRFVKHKRIFHLQIQQGSLLPRGGINVSSLNWKPVSEFGLLDDDIYKDRDYHTLSYESRSIDLDDNNTEDNLFVVTGVKLDVVGAHLNLAVRLSEYDFESGKLVSVDSKTHWKFNYNTDVSGDKRTKLDLIDPDVPTRTITKSVPDSIHNQYIDFTNSSPDKDAAQSTVPFLDIQDVVSNPPVPLSGIGIYHKGSKGYGGFLAPKIITYDFTPHVKLPTNSNA